MRMGKEFNTRIYEQLHKHFPRCFDGKGKPPRIADYDAWAQRNTDDRALMQRCISGGAPSEMTKINNLSVGDYYYLLDAFLLEHAQKQKEIKAADVEK